MTAQTQPAQPEARYLADVLDTESWPGDLSMTAWARRAQAELRRLHAENEQLRDHMQFVERWAVHHGTKPCVSAKEALGVIQHYPPIRRITDGYADGKRPDTFDPYARIAELEAELVHEAQRTAAEKLRADQMTEQHRMQAAMNSEARAKLAQFRESKPQCEWTYNDEYFHWQTGCDNAHQFGDGGIKENSFTHCPYCGGGIGEKTNG